MKKTTQGEWNIRVTDGARWPGQTKPVVAYTIEKEALSLEEIQANANLMKAAQHLLIAVEHFMSLKVAFMDATLIGDYSAAFKSAIKGMNIAKGIHDVGETGNNTKDRSDDNRGV